MKNNFAPDYGLYCLNNQKNKVEYIFCTCKIFQFYRIAENLYSTTSTIVMGGLEYAITVDFPEEIYNDLLKIIHPALARVFREALNGVFTQPKCVDIETQPITIGVNTRLGEIITSENEQYAPFIATKVFS